jgi:hypothetical protein
MSLVTMEPVAGQNWKFIFDLELLRAFLQP